MEKYCELKEECKNLEDQIQRNMSVVEQTLVSDIKWMITKIADYKKEIAQFQNNQIKLLEEEDELLGLNHIIQK